MITIARTHLFMRSRALPETRSFMKPALIAVIILACAAIAVTAILLLPPGPFRGLNPVGGSGGHELQAVEVREYEGQDLSSVNDFHENSIKGPQHINISQYRLHVTGLVSAPRDYTYDELLEKFPSYRKVVTLFCVEGWDATILWEGIRVRDITADVKPLPSATTVVFRASDGYSTSLPLDYVVDRNIIMAYRMNNITLPAERGYPFELVAEDKWGYKWIKWITEIELTSDSNYRGYWEQRGYSNTGDLNRSYFVD